jgi:hypothetical protein
MKTPAPLPPLSDLAPWPDSPRRSATRADLRAKQSLQRLSPGQVGSRQDPKSQKIGHQSRSAGSPGLGGQVVWGGGLYTPQDMTTRK